MWQFIPAHLRLYEWTDFDHLDLNGMSYCMYHKLCDTYKKLRDSNNLCMHCLKVGHRQLWSTLQIEICWICGIKLLFITKNCLSVFSYTIEENEIELFVISGQTNMLNPNRVFKCSHCAFSENHLVKSLMESAVRLSIPPTQTRSSLVWLILPFASWCICFSSCYVCLDHK